MHYCCIWLLTPLHTMCHNLLLHRYMVWSIHFHYRPKLIIHWAWHFLTLLDLIFICIIMQLLHGYDVLYTPYCKNLIATLSDPYIFTVDQSYLIHHGLCTTNANNPLGLILHGTTRFNQYVQLLYGYWICCTPCIVKMFKLIMAIPCPVHTFQPSTKVSY